VSEYDADAPVSGPRNLFQATANDLTLRGFRGSSFVDRLADMTRDMTGWLSAGHVRPQETVFDGLERAPEALIATLAGTTAGKALVKVS
jgi:NADPH-dependent curcumin reductase CurA